MSIILDALRKAEAGRREPDRVGLIGAPLTRVPLRSRIPLWLPLVAIVLLLSAGVGAYVMRQSRPAPTSVAELRTPPPATESKTAPEAPVASAPDEIASLPAPATWSATAEPAEQGDSPEEHPDVRSLSLEARAATPAPPSVAALKPQRGSIEVRDLGSESADGATAQPRIKPGSVEVRDLLVEQGAPPVPPESESPAPQARVANDRAAGTTAVAAARPAQNPPPQSALAPMPAPPVAPAIPTVDDLVASGQLEPPNLSLDMHAYGDDPDARFVYINMRRYHNGDTTREGAVVEEITPDGVVMRLHGLRFLLQSR